jgi:hypothetical protein
MQTFWLQDGSNSGSLDGMDASTVVSSDTLDSPQIGCPSSLHSEKVLRLIDWNVDILLCLLKQIASKRIADEMLVLRSATCHESGCLTESRLAGAMPLNEVQEVIRLPDFNKSNAQTEDVKKTTLNPAVEKQLFDYVSSVASMYRDNPFHNFEHVSDQYSTVLRARIVGCNLTRFTIYLDRPRT